MKLMKKTLRGKIIPNLINSNKLKEEMILKFEKITKYKLNDFIEKYLTGEIKIEKNIGYHDVDDMKDWKLNKKGEDYE